MRTTPCLRQRSNFNRSCFLCLSKPFGGHGKIESFLVVMASLMFTRQAQLRAVPVQFEPCPLVHTKPRRSGFRKRFAENLLEVLPANPFTQTGRALRAPGAG